MQILCKVHSSRNRTLKILPKTIYVILMVINDVKLHAQPITLINVVSQSTPIEWHNNSHLVSEQKKMIVIKTHLNDKCIWQNDFFIEKLSSIWSQKILWWDTRLIYLSKMHKCTDCPRQLAWQNCSGKMSCKECTLTSSQWTYHYLYTKWIPKTDLGNHHPEVVDGPMQWRFPRETHWVKYANSKILVNSDSDQRLENTSQEGI